MARIHGRFGQVSRTDGSPDVIFGSISEFTLNQSRDYVEVTCFQDTNKQYVVGLGDISGTINFFYNLDAGSPEAGDSADLFAAADSATPVTLKLMPNTNDTTHYWTGDAYIDLGTITVSVSGAVSGTANFKGSGNWTRA